MQFVAEVKSGGFKTKMVKEGPPVVVREIKLIVDSHAYCLDEISKMVNQPVRVELNKVQLSFGDSPEQGRLETRSDRSETPTPRSKTKRVRRKTVLRD